jgi:hypothetical protein
MGKFNLTNYFSSQIIFWEKSTKNFSHFIISKSIFQNGKLKFGKWNFEKWKTTKKISLVMVVSGRVGFDLKIMPSAGWVGSAQCDPGLGWVGLGRVRFFRPVQLNTTET